MTEQKKPWWHPDRLTTFHKSLLLIIAIVTLIWGTGRVALAELRTAFKEISAENDQETLEQLKQLGFLTSDEFHTLSDSILTEIAVNRITNDSLHLRSFRNQDQIILDIEDARYTDSSIQKRIDQLERSINEIKGISSTALADQSAQAYTDSLQNELLLIKQKQTRVTLMRQLDQQHRDEMNRLRDLSKDIVIDKGRRKTIRSKPKGAKQGRVTKKNND